MDLCFALCPAVFEERCTLTLSRSRDIGKFVPHLSVGGWRGATEVGVLHHSACTPMSVGTDTDSLCGRAASGCSGCGNLPEDLVLTLLSCALGPSGRAWDYDGYGLSWVVPQPERQPWVTHQKFD